jgi:hypothetical protein
VQSPNGSVVAIYCHHNKAGAMFIKATHSWRVYGPVGGVEFANALVLSTLDAGWQGNENFH